MNVKQISVLLDNSPGKLCEMTEVLAEKRISIRALTVANSTDTSTVRLIVDNVIWTSSVLRDAGFTVSFSDVLAVEVPNVPGGLTGVLSILKAGGVNIEYMYDVGARQAVYGGHVCIMFRFSDNERAAEVLNDAGIRMLGQGELAAF
ncbi:MAG: hypothetical protein IJS28_06355 [Synergistaceae bacterium]|nr:hypothetical protein [Synergistaceae bacterium]